MKPLIISEHLKTRLGRVDNNIARALLNKTEADEASSEYINYLSISEDNCEFISYLNKAKEDRYENESYELQVIEEGLPYIVVVTEGTLPKHFDSYFEKNPCPDWDGKYYVEQGHSLVQVKAGIVNFYLKFTPLQ